MKKDLGERNSTPPPCSFGEPIAIIGIGCRFPGGANSPDSFWKLLCDGVDAVTEVPADRWNMDKFYDPDPGKPGKSYARHGGFIQGVDLFDPEFFGISHREAARMDPQQRLLLEVTWEALEDAGQVIDRKKANDSGVFIGISSWDYSKVESSLWEMDTLNSHTGTGLALSIAANRISHVLNLTGPSIAIDTACSSSLVAVDLACKSLWNGECRTALAGGVNVILNPESYVIYCRLSMLSRDGRCKAFDARGDGFVKAEGAGVVVLKRLSLALKDQDPIYALIRGSRVNQDGHTPGITVPNRESQERLLKQVYEQAHVAAADVTYFEAHGPGTRVGDPVEAEAIGTVLGEYRAPDHHIYLGSVKSNIGHLEAAAGIAGLIKTALVIKHRIIPPNLHFKEPNPDIDFEKLRLKVPLEITPWPEGRPVLGSVNSFGFGGTNAHVLLSSAPESEPPRIARQGSPPRDYEILAISAHNRDSLYAYAGSVRDELAGPRWEAVSLHDICRTAGRKRFHHPHRLCLVAGSKGQLAAQLNTFLNGETAPGMSSGQAQPQHKIKTAFVFSGQGPQWWAMGRELFRKEPVFREAILRCHELLREYSDWSLLDELNAEEKNSRLDRTAIAQPAIFALQAALTALWESWGIRPQAVVGHSVGEVAAAYAAGVLPLEDALRVIYHRGRCMDKASSAGKMLAVGMGPRDVQPYLEGKTEKVSVAAINSPDSVTLSGDADPLEEIRDALNGNGIFARFLPVNYAFHSHHMEGMRDDLLESIQGIRIQKPRLGIYSTVSGRPAESGDFEPEYWWRNIRRTVNFAAAVEGLLDEETNVFIEVGPNPVLSSAVTECLLRRDRRGWVFPSLRRKDPEHMTMLSTLGGLHTLGVKVDWSVIYPEAGPPVPFPKYAWSHESCWHQTEHNRVYIHGPDGNPLLGQRLSGPALSWENEVNAWMLRYLNDHRIQGQTLLPGTAFIEIALAAARSMAGDGPAVLENLKFQKAVFLSDGNNVSVLTNYDAESLMIQVHSRQNDGSSAWQLNASGRILPPQQARRSSEPLEEIRGRLKTRLDAEACYRKFVRSGIEYGPSFRGIRQLFSGEEESLAEIAVPECLKDDLGRYEFHPAVLDACLQAMIGSVLFEESKSYLPVSIERIHVLHPPSFPMWSHVQEAKISGDVLEASILVLDDGGRVLVDIQGIKCQGMEEKRGTESPDVDEMFYEFRWIPKDRDHDALPAAPEKPWPAVAQILKTAEALNGSLEATREPEGLDELAASYVVNAFRKLGWKFDPGRRFTIQELLENLGLGEARRRLAENCLRILGQADWIRRSGKEYAAVKALSEQDLRYEWRRLWTEYPAWNAVLLLLEKCGENLAGVLQGKVKPQELLWPDGEAFALECLFRDAAPWRYANLLVQHVVRESIDRLPGRHRVRILEINAGTGAITSFLIPVLAEYDIDYVFTDASEQLLEKARLKFQDHPFINFQLLDIEKDPGEQGFGSHLFDLVLINRRLRSSRDPRAAIENAGRLLASRGIFIAVEPISTAAWSGLIQGIAEDIGKSHEADPRADQSDLSLARWRRLLRQTSFSEADGIGAGHDSDGHYREALLIGRGSHLPTAEPSAADFNPEPKVREHWLIFNDGADTGRRLAGLLERAGARSVLVSPGEAFRSRGGGEFEINPDSRGDLGELLRSVSSEAPGVPFKGIVHLWSLDFPRSDHIETDGIHRLLSFTCLNVLYLVQELNARSAGEWPRICLVTRTAQSVERHPQEVSPFQSALWGLGRVIQNEFPQARCRLIDLGPDGRGDAARQEEVEALYAELRPEDREDEIAFRGRQRYVHRLMKTPLVKNQAPRTAFSQMEEPPYRLETSRPGVINNLVIRRFEKRPPEDTEIEIRVHAAGLNFSDVMKALNLYPGLPEGLIPLGIECAGVVTRVGRKVRKFRPGDRVYALAKPSFGSHTTVIRQGVMHLPDHLSYAEAATIPIAFLTAFYGLVHAAGLRKGERVLIHSATGGVGLAAIQIARDIGAEIFATAGTEERRRLLRGLGIEHVCDSRSLEFAADVMERTGGEGVDVILNSLSGEAIPKGLSVLRDSGRFIEIGKRDIYGNKKVGLLPFKNNLSFHAVDLDKVIREQPDFIADLLKVISEKVRKGTFRPLPFRMFPLSMANEAFRNMAQARHIGKIILTVGDHHLPVAWQALPISFAANASYLITGGFGGFGLLIAKWMAANGAQHLALMGRSGPASEEARRAVQALEKDGARVLIIRGDTSKEEDTAAALNRISAEMPPLRGVVHAAMVLEDRLLADLDRERMEKVLDPKMKGAWNLHRLTLGLQLDFFILFSSVSSLIGNPGQGNYVAANAFLDGLSFYRRSRGLPSLTINWGYLAEVGVAARNKDIRERFEHMGLKSFSPDEALDALGRLIRANPVETGVIHMDWSRWMEVYQSFERSPKYAHLLRREAEGPGQESSAAEGPGIHQAFIKAAAGDRAALLESALSEQVAKILGASVSKLDKEKPLTEHGFDSLMAVELRNWVDGNLKITLPTMEIMRGPSIRQLTQRLIEIFTGSAVGTSPENSGKA